MIHPALATDFNAIYPLFVQLWPGKPIDRDALCAVFERAAASETDALLCLETEGQIAGFCAYAIVNNLWQEGQIAYIYAAQAKKRGLKRVELDSGFPREKAHAFYERLAFEKHAYLFSYTI